MINVLKINQLTCPNYLVQICLALCLELSSCELRHKIVLQHWSLAKANCPNEKMETKHLTAFLLESFFLKIPQFSFLPFRIVDLIAILTIKMSYFIRLLLVQSKICSATAVVEIQLYLMSIARNKNDY